MGVIVYLLILYKLAVLDILSFKFLRFFNLYFVFVGLNGWIFKVWIIFWVIVFVNSGGIELFICLKLCYFVIWNLN